jgi:hypothetical protein
MSDVTQASPDGIPRTETGEIKPATTQTAIPEPKTETEPKEGTEPKAEPKAAASVLNQKDLQGAPEKYEDFKVPEDFELNKDVMDKATPMFKELGLSQAGAQRLIDFYAEQQKSVAEAPYKLWADTQKEWVDQVKADPEIGGKLPEVKATVAKALDALGDQKLANEFKAAMDYTGAGNHPAFVKAFYKMALMMTEGGHVAGRGPSPAGQRGPGATPESAAKAMYPNLP